jgi:ribosomal protein L40E
MSDERRCRSCGALVAADAQWCGQCFAPVREPEPIPEPIPEPAPSVATTGTGGKRRAPYWPCTVCGAENPLESELCGTCGTPFVHVMRAEPDRGAVDPDAVFRRSLVFPGLGHRMVGRPMDGLARGVLFAISAVMAALTGITAKNPVTTVVFVVLLVVAIAVYVGSAVEARNLARGGELLVSSRTLMWILVGLVFTSVGILGFSVVTALRK